MGSSKKLNSDVNWSTGSWGARTGDRESYALEALSILGPVQHCEHGGLWHRRAWGMHVVGISAGTLIEHNVVTNDVKK